MKSNSGYHMQPSAKKYLFFISQDYSFPVLRPLQQAIRKRGDDLRWFLYGNEINTTHLKQDEKALHSVSEIIAYNPDAVFVPGNVVPSFIPGLKVQVFHGLPSEKRTKKGQLYHYIIRGMFDLYCTQGPSSTKIFQTLASKYQYFHVEETGWSKLDPLFTTQTEHTKEKKSIFFASTFSPRFSKARELYPFIRHMIQSHPYHWYITLHPKMSPHIVSLYHSITSDNVTFVDATNVITYMPHCDIMLCDTSSIIYEFLTQHKPVVTFQTHKEAPYLINVKQIEKLEHTLLETLRHPQQHTHIIAQAIQEIHPYQDGKSSERVLDITEKMLAGKHLPVRKKPWNFIRNFKLRRELNYWKPSAVYS